MVVNPTRFYFFLPVWLQNALLSMYGARLQRIRYGGIYPATLAELLESQHWPASKLEADQLARLSRLLTHARSTVPHYQGQALPASIGSIAEIRRLPTISKDNVRAEPESFISSAFERSNLLEVHTGGTTGTPLTVLCDGATLQRNYAFFARLRHWAGIPADARVATFAGRTIVSPAQEHPPFWRRNRSANTVLYSSYHISPASIPQYVAHLAQWKPDLIDSYPSSIEPIARHLVAKGITTIRPRAVITSSETLHDEVRAIITQAFGAPVFDHYGGAEMAAFVSQCERGTYHVNQEFGIVEVLCNGEPARAGDTGEIVATGFVNPVMPLIRYRTGDLAVVSDKPCPCGRALPALERIVGRLDDVVVTPEGRRVGRLDPIFKAVSSFHEARIVQDERDHVRVEYVAEADIAPAEQAALLRELGNRLGPSMRITVLRVPAIARTAGGKLRMVVNEMSR